MRPVARSRSVATTRPWAQPGTGAMCASRPAPRATTPCVTASGCTASISVLSPVGAALLGLRVGDTARWTGPGGQRGSARVSALLFQPEASGDYTT